MEIKRFELSCFCRLPDGALALYDVVIEEPFQVSPDEWACHMEGSAVKGPPFTVHGINPEQAYALAFEFLHIGLQASESALENDQGRPVTLPRFKEHEFGGY